MGLLHLATIQACHFQILLQMLLVIIQPLLSLLLPVTCYSLNHCIQYTGRLKLFSWHTTICNLTLSVYHQ